MQYVIDASAALAFLRGEKGEDFLDQVDDPDSVYISTINLGEVASRQLRDNPVRADVENTIAVLGLISVPVTEKHAYEAAEFRESARATGLSQADCICLALTHELDAILLTADRAMADFAIDRHIKVELIR